MNLLRITVLLLIWAVSPLNAQHGNSRVEALRTEFISRRLELSPVEMEKFWPVYHEYMDKLQALKKNLKMAYRRRPEPLTDAAAEELLKLELQNRQAETDLHRLYSEKLKAIIGSKKMVRLRIAEEEFKRELIKTIRDGSES